MTQEINQQLGNYLLQQLLRQNEITEIYIGEHIHEQKQVVVKLFRGQTQREDGQAFLNQLAITTQLQHPHIIPIFEYGIVEDSAYLVMDYATGGSLRERHPRGTQVSFSNVLAYVQQMSSALQYVHEQGLVHRDVKSHNMLLGSDGNVMLSDFEAAVTIRSLNEGRSYDFEGTILYTAPEQLQGHPHTRSDQYALGAVAYEWLSGDWLFTGGFHEIAHQHLFIDPPALQERGISCPPNIEQVLQRTLQKDPAKRFANIKLFADELEWAYKVAQAKGWRPQETAQERPQAVMLDTVKEQEQVARPDTVKEQRQQRPKRQFRSPISLINNL